MTDMLALSAHLPVVEFAPGEAVVSEGGPSGSIWVLVSGALRVRKGDIQVNTITNPGALIGEMSILQGTNHGATVEATEHEHAATRRRRPRAARQRPGDHEARRGRPRRAAGVRRPPTSPT